MTILQIEVDEADLALVNDLCAMLNETAEAQREPLTTHGTLTPESLARMLLEDAALCVRRPGSWEGAGLWDVLAKHGYSA